MNSYLREPRFLSGLEETKKTALRRKTGCEKFVLSDNEYEEQASSGSDMSRFTSLSRIRKAGFEPAGEIISTVMGNIRERSNSEVV